MRIYNLIRPPVIAALVIALYSSPMAFAGPTVRDHLQNSHKDEYQANMNIWLDGVVGAFLAGNAELIHTRKQTPLFCIPKDQGISSADSMRLINSEVASRRWKDFVPLSSVLLDALQRSYPCKQK